jgi:opacity protein-like surface antigen
MGINLRLEGVLMGNRDNTRAGDAGMGGFGLSFRYRPVPHFALDAGIDVFGGRDWNGFRRSETALLLSGIIFVNPYSPVQFYLLGGFGFSGAEVDYHATTATAAGGTQTIDERREYSYFGAHFGPGLEFRVSRRVALNLDLIGFVRGRTDGRAVSEPEFVDPNNPERTTNTSGGGLLRGGITFYW